MAVSAVLSNHYKYKLEKKDLNLSTDSIKILLMRDDFIFNEDNYAVFVNLRTTSGIIANITFDDTGPATIVRALGNFITNGFVVGNKITTNSANAANQGPFLVSGVIAGTLTITTMAGALPALTDGAEVNVTVLSDDEHATVGGYVQNTKVLTGQVVSENDVDNCAYMTCANVTWTGAGPGFGPSPGALLFDDTVADKTIIGYLDFDGDQTIPAADDLVLAGIRIKVA